MRRLTNSLEWIELEGFKTYREKTRLDLTGGLCFLSGQNVVDDIGSNGAGKSSIWDGVCWCLYGRTHTGLRAGNIITWGEKTCSVEIGLMVQGQSRTIKRTQSPNSLLLDEKPVTQEEVENLLGLDLSGFTQSVLFGQHNSWFFTAPSSERLQLFSKVMELDIWEQCGAEAVEGEKSLKGSVTACEKELAVAEERLNGAKRAVLAAQRAKDAWEFERNKTLEQFKAEVDDLQKRIVEEEYDLAALAGELLECVQAKTLLETELRSESDRVQGLHRELQDAKTDVSVALSQLVSNRKTLEEFDKLTGSTCPVCFSKVSDEHKENVRCLLNDACEAGEQVVERQKKISFDVNRRMNDAQEPLIELEHYLALHRGQEEVLLSRKREITANLNSREEAKRRELDRCKRQAELKNPNTALEMQKLKEVENAEAECRGLSDTRKQLSAEVVAMAECKELFKSIRLWLIDRALDELQLLTNTALSDLGLGNWHVEFLVERETTSGTLSKGLHIQVRNSSHDSGVDGKVWSGGEGQRLKIAIQIALASLIQRRRGVEWVTEVWDEPTAHLTEAGVSDLIQLFSDRTERKTVWLTDHRSVDSGLFDRVVTVVKTTQGSEVRE